MKKILVPTDVSEHSRRALNIALELARKFNAEVELLFVVADRVIYSFGEADIYVASSEQVEKEGELALKSMLKEIDISGISLNKKTLHGNPSKVILQEVENEAIDLVVMGSHGYGAVVGSVLGSVSQKVLHGARCAVLIAK